MSCNNTGIVVTTANSIIRGIDGKSPYIGPNNTWYVWDPISLGFIDTGINAEGGGGTPINVIDNLTSTSTSDALSANQGRLLNEAIGGGGSTVGVVDSLVSTSITDALSANQGRILNENAGVIDNKLNMFVVEYETNGLLPSLGLGSQTSFNIFEYLSGADIVLPIEQPNSNTPITPISFEISGNGYDNVMKFPNLGKAVDYTITFHVKLEFNPSDSVNEWFIRLRDANTGIDISYKNIRTQWYPSSWWELSFEISTRKVGDSFIDNGIQFYIENSPFASSLAVIDKIKMIIKGRVSN